MKRFLKVCFTVLAALTAPSITLADEATRNLQQALLDAGFDPNGVDGAMGRGTKSAFEAFWEEQKLNIDHRVLSREGVKYWTNVVIGFDKKRADMLQKTMIGFECENTALAGASALKPVLEPGANPRAEVFAFRGILERIDGQSGHPMIFLADEVNKYCALLGGWRDDTGAYLKENGGYVFPWKRTADRKKIEVSIRLDKNVVVMKSSENTRSIAVKSFE